MEVFVKEEEWNQIRKATHQGRVVGCEAFQEQMGSKLGQRPKEETDGCAVILNSSRGGSRWRLPCKDGLL